MQNSGDDEENGSDDQDIHRFFPQKSFFIVVYRIYLQTSKVPFCWRMNMLSDALTEGARNASFITYLGKRGFCKRLVSSQSEDILPCSEFQGGLIFWQFCKLSVSTNTENRDVSTPGADRI